MSYPISYRLEASYKRGIRGKTLQPITNDYTMREVNSMLSRLLGTPGKNAGKAQNALSASAGTASNGMNTSAYTSAQQASSSIGSSAAAGASMGGPAGAAIGTAVGLVDTALSFLSADIAYKRQKEFYDTRLSMPAQVSQFEEAGLNPMGLAGGSGATSAPSVSPADVSGVTDVLGALLGYKAQMARIGVEQERVSAYREGVASQIALRQEQRITQEKINEWYDTNQVANLDKVESETERNLQAAATEEQKQALIFNQAIAQAIKNQYANEWERNSLALQEAELRYKESATAENYASVRVLSQKLQNMVLDAAYTVSKTENMQACTSYLGIKTDMLKFDKEHQRADKVWQRIGQAVSSVEGVTRSAANVFSCFTHIPAPPAASPRSRPVSADEMSGFDLVDVFAGAY